jgi:hypothetical protein
MTIHIDLPAESEASLRDSAARKDAAAVRRLLSEAVEASLDAAVEELLRDPDHALLRRADGLTDAEFETLADELADMTPAVPSLPDDAITREGIYAEHP